MLDTFVFSINAVLPLVCLASIGYYLRRINFLTDEFIKVGNKFTFRVCLMCLMVVNMYGIKEFGATYKKIMLFSVVSTLILIAISFVYVAFFVKDPKQKGVISQAFFRSNFAIIGIPLAQSLYGNDAGSVASVILACTIPIFNIFSVIGMTIFLKDGNHKFSIKSMLYKIITNPLIDGISFGAIVLALRPHVNGWSLQNGELRFFYKIIENLAKIASPLALVILGGQFKFSAVKRLFGKIAGCVLLRLVIVPVIGMAAAHYFFPEFGGLEYSGLIALFGCPLGVSSAIMATQMDNDGELAGQILVWTTLFSGFTLFCFISYFRMVGIF